MNNWKLANTILEIHLAIQLNFPEENIQPFFLILSYWTDGATIIFTFYCSIFYGQELGL